MFNQSHAFCFMSVLIILKLTGLNWYKSAISKFPSIVIQKYGGLPPIVFREFDSLHTNPEPVKPRNVCYLNQYSVVITRIQLALFYVVDTSRKKQHKKSHKN